MEEARGFIVAAWEEGREGRTAGARRGDAAGRIFLTGRLDDGRSFAAVVKAPNCVEDQPASWVEVWAAT